MSTGMMVAAMLPPAIADRLAVEDGEDPATMHVTLAYLGDTEDPERDVDAVRAIIPRLADLVAEFPRLAGELGRTVQSFPAGEDGVPWWASVNVPGLEELREAIVAELDAAGVWYSTDHGAWVPHVTLAYRPEGEPGPTAEPVLVTFEDVTVAIAGEHVRLPLDLAGILEAMSASAARVAKDRALSRLADPLERDLAGIFRTQGKFFLAGFRKLRDRFPVTESVAEAVTDAEWERVFEDAMQRTRGRMVKVFDSRDAKALRDGGTAQAAAIGHGVSFTLSNPRAVAYMNQHGAELVRGIEDTTRSYLRTILTEAVERGWGYDRTADAITARFAEFAEGVPQQHIDSRAHLIAVTETARAYEAGNRIVADDLAGAGLTMQKQWLTVGDDRVDPDCEDNEAEGWVPLEADFPDGSQEPPAHPACRCTVLYQQDPEELAGEPPTDELPVPVPA